MAAAFDGNLAVAFARQVPPGLAIIGDEGVEIDERGDSFRRAIGNTGCDHAAIAVGAQDYFREILHCQQFGHIGDMGVEIDASGWAVRQLIESAQGHRIGLVARVLEPRDKLGERSAAVPTARNQDKTSHRGAP